NMTRIRDGRWGDTAYRYDVNDQITQAKGGVRTLPREEAFSYDVNLNIRQYGQTPNRHFEVMAFTKQAQQSGRVIKRDEDDYRYNDCGRLVEKTVLTDGFRPQRWRYRWDAQGQLSELITPQGECWTYRYDAFGRRISKRRQGTTKGIAGYDYQWRGDQLVAETPVYVDGRAATGESVYWLYEPGALTPGARYEKGQLHYVVRDHMGTPRELLTESGEVVWAQKLSVWGRSERYRFGGWNAPNDESGPGCPWRFAGQWEDEESGLYYNRFRYYDSEAVQYLTPDPIGLRGGINPYSYVTNPVVYVDPFGLCSKTISSNPSTGNPAAIARGYGSLNSRQQQVLDKLNGFGSQTITSKAFGNQDLAALSAATGDEFAMFSTGGRRLIIRGNATSVPIDMAKAQELSAQGWRWSSHVHPDGTLMSSDGDRAILGAMGGQRSAIFDPDGNRKIFTPDGDSMEGWLP
ncbi:RHS domain-containing protein, partial [Salmonella enterica]|uniref:RHS repeat domain-containing protein n=1 Tax=Salmonella enterica TaxID=28901 RepID=UPI0026DB6C04